MAESETKVALRLEQRRLIEGYDGSLTWSDWDWLEWNVPPDLVQTRLAFWRELNDFAVRERGKSAVKEYRVREINPGESE